jgi:hypothetical protein
MSSEIKIGVRIQNQTSDQSLMLSDFRIKLIE